MKYGRYIWHLAEMLFNNILNSQKRDNIPRITKHGANIKLNVDMIGCFPHYELYDHYELSDTQS